MTKVEHWGKSAGYGSHRICRKCGNVTITTMAYGEKFECSVKKAECGSGAVKPSHSCCCWKEKVQLSAVWRVKHRGRKMKLLEGKETEYQNWKDNNTDEGFSQRNDNAYFYNTAVEYKF